MIPPPRFLLAVLLTAMLLWAPLPYGSVLPRAELALRLASFAALGLAAFAARREELRRALPVTGAMLALAALGWLQSVPLPAFVVGLLSPAHLELYRAAGELPSVTPGWASLSLAPEASRATALTWASLAAVYLSAFVAGTSRRERRWFTYAVVALALAQLVWGLRQMIQGQAPRLHGTFVNPAHASLYLEIALALACAWLWWALTRFKKKGLRLESKLGTGFSPLMATALIAVALALTGSRAGVVAAVLGLTAQVVAWIVAQRQWRFAWLAALPLSLAIAGIYLLGRGFDRLTSTSVYDVAWSARVEAWTASLGLLGRFPVLGSGLGTYIEAFPLVQPASLTNRTWDHAHNDFLELALTGGVVGLAIALAGLFLLCRRLFRVVRAGVRTEHRVAGLAALGALAAVAFHELIDFGLTLPANAYTLAILCGAAAASRLTAPSREGEPRRRRRRVDPSELLPPDGAAQAPPVS